MCKFHRLIFICSLFFLCWLFIWYLRVGLLSHIVYHGWRLIACMDLGLPSFFFCFHFLFQNVQCLCIFSVFGLSFFFDYCNSIWIILCFCFILQAIWVHEFWWLFFFICFALNFIYYVSFSLIYLIFRRNLCRFALHFIILQFFIFFF